MIIGLFCAALRDFARFGMIFTPSGSVVSGEQIISDMVLERIRTGGHPGRLDTGDIAGNVRSDFPGLESFTNACQWDVIFPGDRDLFKAGVGGQGLYVFPDNDAVVVFFMTGTGGEPAPLVARAIVQSLD